MILTQNMLREFMAVLMKRSEPAPISGRKYTRGSNENRRTSVWYRRCCVGGCDRRRERMSGRYGGPQYRSLNRRSFFYRGRVKDHVRSQYIGRDSDLHPSVYSGCAIFDPGNWTEQSIQFVFPIPD